MSAGAYTNSYAGATATQLFDIHSVSDALTLQSPPNDGALSSIGALGVAVEGDVGMDIANRIFENTGASSATATSGLDLYWRNLRTHSLHDPVDYKKLEVGAYFLNGTVQPVSLYT